MDMATYENDLDFLTQLSYRLNDLSMCDPIKDIALPMIQQYTLAPYAHFTHYDPTEQTLRISHIQAESTILKTIIAYTGKKIFSTLTPVDQEGYELIASSGISFLSSLTDLSFGAIPPILDQAIKKLTGFSTFCAIPQIDQGMLFGTTILAFKKQQHLPSAAFLKSYSSILSLALRKKQSEEKLHEKEQMLLHLTDSMGEVFWMRNKDNSKIYYINHAYEKIWGRSCESMLENPKSFYDALHPEDKAKVLETYGNFQKPYGINLEYRIIHPDKGIRWINARTYPVQDQHHHTYAYAGFAIDITEQKKTEFLQAEHSALQSFLLEVATKYINIKPEEIQQAIQDALAELGNFLGIDRVYIFSYDWEKQECSNTFEWCAESIPSVIQDLQHLPLAMAPTIADAHQKGENFLLEDLDSLNESDPMKEFLLGQGIQSMISIPLFQQSICTGFVGFDSVKQKQFYSDKEKAFLRLFAEVLENVLEKQNLTESKEREIVKFNKLFYTNPALMAVSEASGRKFIEVNDTFLQTLELTREEVIGKTSAELNIFIDNERHNQVAEQLKKNDYMRNIEMAVRTRHGKILHGLFSGEVFYQDGVPFFLTVMIDITEQKRMETLKQQLIEKLSHEFRTPLSSLKQAFSLVEDHVLRHNPELCQILNRNILRLEGLLDKIIDFNVLNQESVSLLRVKTRINDLMVEVQEKMSQLHPGFSISINSKNPNMIIYLDELMFRKISEEIIQNAVQHGQADSIQIDIQSTPAYDQIVFIDNGRGIPEEDLPNVFDPFFQSKQEYQTKRGKAGLGLSVAKKIVEAHGATLSIQSPESKGTIVSITLPRMIFHSEA
jgi:PAS domain S-box-containing protein